MRSESRQSGFTLMGVLIALAILGIGMLAVISVAGTSTRMALNLKQRTFAHWVAMNEATRLQVMTRWPDTGQQNGQVKLANQTWQWTTKISKTVVPNLRRADISVALESKPDNAISSLIIFIGKPTVPPRVNGKPGQQNSAAPVESDSSS